MIKNNLICFCNNLGFVLQIAIVCPVAECLVSEHNYMKHRIHDHDGNITIKMYDFRSLTTPSPILNLIDIKGRKVTAKILNVNQVSKRR